MHSHANQTSKLVRPGTEFAETVASILSNHQFVILADPTQH
jgi:hypothetical protein